MVGRRHAADEIATKLAQANELAAKGKSQREIAKALGVSIMTYHRWRKGHDVPARAGRSRGASEAIDLEARPRGTMSQLELENLRLRRLVTDLLLEKLKLEEEIRSRTETRVRRSR